MANTLYYSFPLMAEAQSSKYLTHNDAIVAIDLQLHGLTGPPVAGLVLSTGTAFGAVTVDSSLAFASATLSLNRAHSNVWSKAQQVAPVGLSDVSSVALDLSLSNNFTLTIGGNRTLAAASNVVAGQAGQIVVTQDGTGSRTLAFNAIYKFAGGVAPTLSTAAGAVDILSYYVISSAAIAVSATMQFS